MKFRSKIFYINRKNGKETLIYSLQNHFGLEVFYNCESKQLTYKSLEEFYEWMNQKKLPKNVGILTEQFHKAPIKTILWGYNEDDIFRIEFVKV